MLHLIYNKLAGVAVSHRVLQNVCVVSSRTVSCENNTIHTNNSDTKSALHLAFCVSQLGGTGCILCFCVANQSQCAGERVSVLWFNLKTRSLSIWNIMCMHSTTTLRTDHNIHPTSRTKNCNLATVCCNALTALAFDSLIKNANITPHTNNTNTHASIKARQRVRPQIHPHSTLRSSHIIQHCNTSITRRHRSVRLCVIRIRHKHNCAMDDVCRDPPHLIDISIRTPTNSIRPSHETLDTCCQARVDACLMIVQSEHIYRLVSYLCNCGGYSLFMYSVLYAIFGQKPKAPYANE